MPSCSLHTLNHTPHTHGALLQKKTSLLIAAVLRLLMPLCSHTTGQFHSPRCCQAMQEGGSHQGAARIWCHRVGEEEYVCEEGEKEEGLGRGIEWTRTNDAVHTLQRAATHCTTCCNTLHKALQHTATYCHTLQHPATPTDECKEATADACVCGDLIKCYSSIRCYS